MRDRPLRTCSTLATAGSLSRSKIAMHSCAMFKCSENCKNKSVKPNTRKGKRRPTNLVPLLLILRQVCKHILHVVQVRSAFSAREHHDTITARVER